ncbi:uncharacterized protein LOC107363946 [Tetranychus urticae]|uniref:Uncharacterized protein n=1 Tax=Tetranychus urticae TaxID=32264 RepID=T1KHD4_TETUR|nr:uncharacterized protein LOC107363946 [Tetranychus urticae]
MPFFYLHSSREQLCLQKRIPAHICFSLNHIHHSDPESLRVERSEAIIYSLVIVVFYAAIILIVVGTNMHRCRKRRQRLNRQHIINQKTKSPSIIVSINSGPENVNNNATPLVTLSSLNQIDSTMGKGSPV